MSLAKATVIPTVLALATLAACDRKVDAGNDDARMAQAMRKVEADQAKSDKLVMERTDAETQRELRIQKAIGKQ